MKKLTDLQIPSLNYVVSGYFLLIIAFRIIARHDVLSYAGCLSVALGAGALLAGYLFYWMFKKKATGAYWTTYTVLVAGIVLLSFLIAGRTLLWHYPSLS